jgi:hypothetical protein
MVLFKEYQQNRISLNQLELKRETESYEYVTLSYIFLMMVGLCQQGFGSFQITACRIFPANLQYCSFSPS